MTNSNVSACILATLLLAGCSGGGSSIGTAPPVDGRLNPDGTEATPYPYNQHPLYKGATFRFSGAVTSTLTLQGKTTTNSETDANNMTTLYPAGFNGQGGFADFHESVNAVGPTTALEVFDNYEKYVPQKDGAIFLDDAGNQNTYYLSGETQTSQAVFAPEEILDIIPHASGNSWIVTPGTTFTLTDIITAGSPQTTEITQTTDAVGAYSENDHLTFRGGSYLENFTFNDDGTADRTVVYGQQPYPSTWERIGLGTTTCKGINAQPGSAQIPVTTWSNYTKGLPNGNAAIGPGTTPNATTVVRTYCMPDWYSPSTIPGNSSVTVPHPVYRGSRTDKGFLQAAALPAGCLSKIGTTVKALMTAPGAVIDDNYTTYTNVDLWGNGYVGSSVSIATIHDYFLQAFGEICDASSYSMKAYGLPQFNVLAGSYNPSPYAGLLYEMQSIVEYQGVSAFTLPQNRTPITASAGSLHTSNANGNEGIAGVMPAARAVLDRMRTFAERTRHAAEAQSRIPAAAGLLARPSGVFVP